MSAKPKPTKRRAANASTKAKRNAVRSSFGDVAAGPNKRGRYEVEPYPRMVAAALRAIHKRDGAEAFEHVARLILRSVATEVYAKRGGAVLRDELSALGYLVR